MNVYKDLNNLPRFTNAVITIGTFDGVHLGHQKIISQLKAEAIAVKGETVVITFHPHPRKIVGDTSGTLLLSTAQEKTALLEQYGIEHLVIIPFDDTFASLSAEAYVQDFLVNKFHPHTIIIGYDHRFGKGRTGNYQLLEHLGHRYNFKVKEIDAAIIKETTISSTAIRKALLHADITGANSLLGYPYFFEGRVIKGDQLGRTIGYPTANLQLNDPEKLVPGDGVYAVKIKRVETKSNNGNDNIAAPLSAYDLQGMMYIGSRPVVNGKRRVIEINIFDFTEDIYGEDLQVQVCGYTRGDMHFNGLEALKEQLAKDRSEVMQLLFNMTY